jgi:hypothetical protein
VQDAIGRNVQPLCPFLRELGEKRRILTFLNNLEAAAAAVFALYPPHLLPACR